MFRSWPCVSCGLACLLLLAGCDQLQSSYKKSLGIKPAPDQPSAAETDAVAEAPANGALPDSPAPVPAEQDVVPNAELAQPPGPAPLAVPPSTANSPSAAGSSATVKVTLSSGVALAQTLPSGTAMGFSVDYQFAQGGPATNGRYSWVIVPAKGEPVSVQVPLEESGTLQEFFLTLRPEHGPFQCYLAEVVSNNRPNPISATVNLR
ncbi:MAG: hypothetical protein AB7O62_13445 [Pirellulales bacterium]